jgi:hypothetical protein
MLLIDLGYPLKTSGQMHLPLTDLGVVPTDPEAARVLASHRGGLLQALRQCILSARRQRPKQHVQHTRQPGCAKHRKIQGVLWQRAEDVMLGFCLVSLVPRR